jgi:orotate phosphoribosyltransferase
MESGYHSSLWLDLDALFASPARIEPLVTALANSLRAHPADAVCGPLLGGAFLAQSVSASVGLEFWYTEPVERIGAGDGLYRAQYRLPPAFISRVAGKRVVLVDDVMSAGSSLRATDNVLRQHGADVVAVGALLMLGDVGATYFAERGVPVEAVAHDKFEMWSPEACPHCAEGLPLEGVA